MNLEAHVQAYADQLGRPIIVFDLEYNVVAFSVHDRDVDHARLAIILSHKGSVRAKESIHKYRVGHATGPVRIPPINGGQSRQVAPVRHEGHLVGYISSTVPEDLLYPDVDENAVRDDPELQEGRVQIGVILAAMALGSQEDENRSLRLATALLEGDVEQRTRAAEDLLAAGLVSPVPHYTVVSIQASAAAESSTATLRLILDRALTMIPVFPTLRAIGAIIDGEVVLVVPYEIDASKLAVLLAVPAFANLRAGVGGAHAHLVDAHRSLREARIAVRGAIIDESHGAAAWWDALGLDRILLQLPLQDLTVADLPVPVQRLLEAQSGPDLAQTLEAYLDYGCDAQRTAQQLHVHRSTLYYRLDRVRAIAEIDLADGRVRRELHTALRVASMAGLR